MGTSWRRTFVRLLVGTAATVAFLVLFLREVDLSQAWKTMSALPAWTLLASLGLIGANLVFMTLRWKYLLSGAGYRVDKRRLFSTIAVGRGANNLLPARGGDLLRIESLRERQVPVFVTAGTLFAERLLDGVVLSVWIVLGAIMIGGPKDRFSGNFRLINRRHRLRLVGQSAFHPGKLRRIERGHLHHCDTNMAVIMQ